MKKLLIYGAGNLGLLLQNLSVICGYQFAGFIDDSVSSLDTYKEAVNKFPPYLYDMVIGLDFKLLDKRWEMYQRVKEDGYDVISLIHPTAIVDKSCKLGEGIIIMAGAVIDFRAKLGDLCVLYSGSIVSHDSYIGENVFLMPHTTICSHSSIGKNSFIGTGVIVINRTKIDENSFIDAGVVYKGDNQGLR